MKSYRFFTNFYDEIVRWTWYSLQDEVDMIDDFIKKYLDKKTDIKVLETACWTWVVSKWLLEKWYDVVGIDISEDMLEKAEENMWEGRCKIADMRDFDLDTEFDVILCNYNSICHLITLSDWRKFFLEANNHLKKWWLFIFDINTIYEFENITRDFAQFFTFKSKDTKDREKEDTVCLEMFKKQLKDCESNECKTTYYYEWLVKMFVELDDGSYELIKETIAENSFEIDTIKQELKSFWFKLLHLEDFHNGEVDDESERVYFISEKV